MERLTAQLLVALAARHELIVIGPPGCRAHVDARVRCHECRSDAAGAFLLEAALRAVALIVTGLRPQLVIATSGLTAPLAWLAARLCRQPYLTIVHGLDLVAASPFYQRVFVPAIRASAGVVANSRNTAVLACARGVDPRRVRIVNPGVSWPVTLPSARAFRECHGLGDRRLLLSVGRLAARKGLPEFVSLAFARIVAAAPDVMLVVIGDEARDAIRQEQSTRARLDAAIDATGLAPHVLLCGHADDDEVVAACVAAQVFIFPLVPVSDDVEGFGMVAAEAAVCGLPTVAFDLGGVSDAIVPDLTGRLVPSGDYAAFVDAVLDELARTDDSGRRLACRDAALRYAWPRYAGEMEAVVAAQLERTSGHAH